MATETKTAPKKTVAKKASSLSAPLFDTEGQTSGSVPLPEHIFGLPWNADLVHQVVMTHHANNHLGIAHTKMRGEVSGGGKKPWRQKGTGRARHGSRRSPIWRGGGITFGPRNERDYSQKANKKMRRKALLLVLSQKLRDGEIIFVESLGLESPKTAKAKELLTNIAKNGHELLLSKKHNAALIAQGLRDVNVERSFQNIGNVFVDEVRNLNARDILAAKYLIIENPDEALKFFNETFT